MANHSKKSERAKRPKQKNEHNFFVVGVGASAGGIRALEEFFEHIPTDSGMAFVVILHLSPEYESFLSNLMQHKTRMPVTQVTQSIKVEPNHVYVIPPAKHLMMNDGHINLTEPEMHRGRRVPIDLFFRTLATTYNSHAIGIVLSGTGTDGTLGLRRIKEEGGIAIAQDPLEAEYDGMPRSAINEGLVDFTLRVAEIPEKLLAIQQATKKIQLPPDGDKPPGSAETKAILEILILLRNRTGHDFSNYKSSTILRRITRRMQVNGCEDLGSYLQYLRTHPKEAKDLQSDLLITVTNFFRDPIAFDSLGRDIVPKLFEGKEGFNQVRAWVIGCATGEEAYSLAILLHEYAERLAQLPSIQIFATDIDEKSIAQAREGIFPETIAADVSAERLKRYFIKDGVYYRVKKEIREMVLFAPHNILRDPPFSRLDLVSCRNLLIYLNRETQDQVLEIIHFALHPNGFLFLGSSESADGSLEFFSSVDKKNRIYRRNFISPGRKNVPTLPQPGRWAVKLPDPVYPLGKISSHAELHYLMLEEYAPPSVLINEAHDIVHISENAGRYLRFAGGELSRHLLNVLHPDLRIDVRAALYSAAQEGIEQTTRRLYINLDGETHQLKVIVRPIHQVGLPRTYLLVIFDENTAMLESSILKEGESEISQETGVELKGIVNHLEEELQQTKKSLRNTVEQYETSTEELRASNEELQAINEELRSASEELETSKEELQSLNEELQTVNYELKDKVDEVSHINSDLQNLLAATDMATIFLDRELRIKRYTPRVEELFNVIPTDIGRLLAHVTHKLSSNVFEDAEKVLRTLTSIEREVRGEDGRWYIVRLLPYRTIDDRIDGVVLTFNEITGQKSTERTLRDSEESLRFIIESAPDYAIFSLDTEGRIETWSYGAEEVFGYKQAEAIGQPFAMLFTPEDRERGAHLEELERAQSQGRSEDNRWHLRKDGTRFFASGVLTPLRDGENHGFVKVARDLTEQIQREEERAHLYKQIETEQERLEERITERTQKLQSEVIERRTAEDQVKELLRQIVSTQEVERLRIARELHDHFGQQLTALRLNLASLKTGGGNENKLLKQVEQAQMIAARLDKDVEFLAWELRPAKLEEVGLSAALENFVREWSQHFSIAADYHTARLGKQSLSLEAEMALYRIGQEALNNIYKHAEASHADVLLERRDNDIVLIVEDDGKGFNVSEASKANKGMGLLSMQERAALVGGKLEIESKPGNGTTVFARAPLAGH